MKKVRSLVLCFCLFAAGSIFAEERPIRVYADIVGDLFHAGHIEFLKKARGFGDYLIVGVIADENVEEYKRTPILTLEERVKIISACRYVDEVIAAPPLRPTKEWLAEQDIDYVVHGDDFNPELLRDQYGASLDLGIFRSVPYTPGISTSNIIQRIVERYEQGEFHKNDLLEK
ncbi:MAG: adenylyltransferase/cytidyltransferase family protein [Chlamydiae bacterium]|nr:adenylyltransferase/cytidyltransferase family protein [Chlamydiota bacterium]